MKKSVFSAISYFLAVISLTSCWLFDAGEDVPYPAKGEIVPRETEGYNWFSYVPCSIKKSDDCYILLTACHPQLENYDELTEAARSSLSDNTLLAGFYKYVLLVPAIPRCFAPEYYPQALDYSSLRTSTPVFYYRPDMKVHAMLEELAAELNAAGYAVQDKIFVWGFSAGGMWSNRYTLLHPERVKAASMGHCGGWLGMPLSEYAGNELNWPMGIGDFAILTGAAYEGQEALRAVPLFVHIGGADTLKTCVHPVYPTASDISIWGSSDPERLANQSSVLEALGYDIVYKLYPGVGHTNTAEMVIDTMDFFADFR